MNKEEVINKINEMTVETFFSKTLFVQQKKVIELIEQLDEPQKVKIPQFVAEIIEYYKGQNAPLYDALREKNFNKQYSEWLLNEQNAYDKVARAWVDGYEVEKEPKYKVKFKGVLKNSNYLNYNSEIKNWYPASSLEIGMVRTKFTRKELEEANFGWVFDCPGIKIEEVKE